MPVERSSFDWGPTFGATGLQVALCQGEEKRNQMLAVGIIAVGVYLAARWSGNKVLFPRTRIESYDSEKFPLQFRNGVSYIYDRPEAETVTGMAVI